MRPVLSACRWLLMAVVVAVTLSLWEGTLSALEIKTALFKTGCLVLMGIGISESIWRWPGAIRLPRVAIPIMGYGLCMVIGFMSTGRSSLNADAFYPQICGILFFLLFIRFVEKENLGTILFLIQALTLVTSVYGILQFFRLDPIPWYDLEGRFRVVSFFGNKNAFGAFLILTIPLCVHRAWQGKTRRELAGGTLIAVIACAALLLSGSRGALLCFVLFGTIGGALEFKRQRVLPSGWIWGALPVAGLLIAGAVWIALPDLVRADYRNLFSDALSRPFFYRIVLEVIGRDWLFGVGPGNFEIAHPLNSSHKLTKDEPELTLDNAHSELLGTWVDYGIFPVGICIGILAFLFVQIRKERRISRDPAHRSLLLMLSWSLSGYMAYGLVTEATRYASSILWFWMIMGIAFVSLSEENRAYLNLKMPRRLGRRVRSVGICSTALIILFATHGIAQGIRSKANLLKGMLSQHGDLEKSLPFLEKATRLDPKSVKAWYAKGFVQFSLGRHEESLACYLKTLALAPDYSNSNQNAAACYYRLQDWKRTIQYARKSAGIYPEQLQALVLLAFCNYYLNQPEISYVYVREAIALDPLNPKIRGLQSDLDSLLQRRQ